MDRFETFILIWGGLSARSHVATSRVGFTIWGVLSADFLFCEKQRSQEVGGHENQRSQAVGGHENQRSEVRIPPVLPAVETLGFYFSKGNVWFLRFSLLVAPLQEAERKVALCDLALSTPPPVKMLFLPGSSTFILTFFPVGSILSQGRAVRPCDKMLPSEKMLKIKMLLFGKQINPLLVAPLQEAERKVALCDLALSTPPPVKMLFLPGSSTFILTFFPVGSILSQGRAVRPCDKMLPSGKMLKIKVLLFGKHINPLLVAPLQEAERKVALCDLVLSTPPPVKMLFLPGSSTFILTLFPVGSTLSQGHAVRP